MRFDRRIQCFGAALFIIKGFIWLPIAIYVPALTFNQVTGINIHVITPIVCGICIFYTSVGGLKAVVFSDFVQAFIVFGTMFLVLLKGTFDVGGFGVVWQRNMDSGRIEIPELTWDPRVRMSMFSVIVGGTMFKLQSLISQPVLQRYLSLPSMKAIKQCIIIFCIGLTLLLGMCCYVGMVIFATYYDCDPLTTKLASAKDQLVPLLVMDVLGQYSGISGLYVSAVFSAALSAMSTLLNSLSAVILEDFAKPFSRNSLTERQTAFIVRAVVVVFGVMAISMVYVVEKLGMVLQLAGTMQSITYGPMMGIFIVGICMPWINTNSVLTGSIISCATMAVICIRSQIALVNKEYVFQEKPVSIEGCTYGFEHIPILNSTLSDQPTEQERPFYLISWLCYSGLGACLNIIFSHMAILVFGSNKREDIDASLVAPFLKKYYKEKKYETVEMFDKIDCKEKSYLERRFDRRIQCFGAVLFLIETTLWLPIAIYVPALTFNQVTGIDIHIITPIVSGICIFYTTVGGIKAVVFADLIQSFIMFGSIFLVAIKGTMKVGGFDVVWQRNMDSGRLEFPELTLDPTVRMSLLCVLIGGTVIRIQGTAISQPAVQRFVSLPSIKHIKQTLILLSIGLTVLLSTCVYIGLVTYATYYDCDPLTTKLAKATDQLVPLLVMEVLGEYPGLAGLFVSAVFSAALSSLSTVLNSMSAVILEDFAKPFSRHSLTERQTAILLRSVVVIFGTIAIAMVYVVEKLGTVLQLSGTLQSVTQGPLFGVFVVGFCMPWVNTKSVIAGSVVSSLIMGWICIRAQIAIFAKEFVAPQKPVSVEGCTYDYGQIPLLNSTLADQPHQVATSQHISWLWYGVFGAVITIIASNMATIVFGRNKKEDVDPDLVAPFLQEYYRANKYDSVPMINKIDPTDLVL